MPLGELAASIEAAGLLHNLVVVRGARGLHEVCAGGRRLRAMAMLVEQGRWAENQPVPVLVVPAEQALDGQPDRKRRARSPQSGG